MIAGEPEKIRGQAEGLLRDPLGLASFCNRIRTIFEDEGIDYIWFYIASECDKTRKFPLLSVI